MIQSTIMFRSGHCSVNDGRLMKLTAWEVESPCPVLYIARCESDVHRSLQQIMISTLNFIVFCFTFHRLRPVMTSTDCNQVIQDLSTQSFWNSSSNPSLSTRCILLIYWSTIWQHSTKQLKIWRRMSRLLEKDTKPDDRMAEHGNN